MYQSNRLDSLSSPVVFNFETADIYRWLILSDRFSSWFNRFLGTMHKFAQLFVLILFELLLQPTIYQKMRVGPRWLWILSLPQKLLITRLFFQVIKTNFIVILNNKWLFLLLFYLKMTKTRNFGTHLLQMGNVFDLGYKYGLRSKHVVFGLDKHKLPLYAYQSL